MNAKQVIGHLNNLERKRAKLGLGRVKRLLSKVGNPQDSLKCVHVAGTNGKGSVCSMIFSALREEGYHVGLYTSPYIKRFNEKIRVDDKFITDKEIVKYFLKLKQYSKASTYFEIVTAIAFLYFKEKKVDYAVLETGLGGRLDATNVVIPLISIITNIGLDHTHLLGSTIRKIAYEKAGIIKKGIPVVTGAKGEALDTIKKIAKKRKSKLLISKKYKKIVFKHLNGNFQQINKDIAITALNALKKLNLAKINDISIIKGLENAKWPGRLEYVSKNVLVDCAHNKPGFQTLKKELLMIKKQKKVKNFIFVICIMKDKDIKSMLKIISPLALTIVFTKIINQRAAKPSELLKIFEDIKGKNQNDAKIVNNPKKALQFARKISKKDELVVICGSIYLVGAIRN